MRALVFAVLLASTYANDTQYVKSVKGGQNGYQYRGGDISRFYGMNNTQTASGLSHGQTINFEVGVCYIEVPTASLVRDPSHIPAGNGSRPDLSRIRTCCKGYQRNVYNFRICDPVCSKGCVNALCTAPETCTCYPDHVKNLAGFCVATCPIGCQNGHCSGGECLCNEGYKLDIDSKFCMPSCAAECDRIGNCTAPHTCECKHGDTHPVCGSNPKVPGNVQPSFPKPNYPQYGNNRPNPGDTVYYNPNQAPNLPLYPYNQHKNDTLIPNQNSSPTPTPFPHGQPNTPSSSNLGPNPHQPNQGQIPQYGQHPPYSTYPITQNITNPYNYPLYPNNQITPNSNNAQLPQNPTNPFSQNSNGPTQGPYYPPVQALNVSISPQYPLYPGNQMGLNNNPNQNGNNPNYPSSNQGPHNMYPYNQGGYPYPQGSNQPHQPGYHYNQNLHPNPYPQPDIQNTPYGQNSYGSNSFNQNSYDQTEDMSTCSGPCTNGFCAENNQCKCNPGYVVDEDDTTGRRCRPHCPGGCPNGYCAAPYSCVCNEGYHKDTSVKGRPLCIKRIRRSADKEKPVNVAELLIFEIPDYSEQ
ncbi:unnamed protein product [Diatraea saccharalis]|uniref:EGF-like domain-containing protein n=1 Tax=Diatraea saccharalis TaxID=40085 RepID=A0A9N9REL5_9NEOP|nr:unnamed protein product [Diatraea saccharalis]